MTKEQLIQFAKDYTSEMAKIMEKKNHDYSSDEDPFENLSMCEKFGLASAEKGILIRITDKLSRIIQLLDKESQVTDESFVDTCIDASNYFMLLAAMKSAGNRAPIGKYDHELRHLISMVKPTEQHHTMEDVKRFERKLKEGKSLGQIISEEPGNKTIED